MKKLELHSFGQNDYIESLKEKYDSLKKIILGNEKLSETKKNIELEILTKSFEKEKKESKNNLY